MTQKHISNCCYFRCFWTTVLPLTGLFSLGQVGELAGCIIELRSKELIAKIEQQRWARCFLSVFRSFFISSRVSRFVPFVFCSCISSRVLSAQDDTYPCLAPLYPTQMQRFVPPVVGQEGKQSEAKYAKMCCPLVGVLLGRFKGRLRVV